MKKLFELLVCFLHLIAVVLMWLDLATRTDIARGSKLAWGQAALATPDCRSGGLISSAVGGGSDHASMSGG